MCVKISFGKSCIIRWMKLRYEWSAVACIFLDSKNLLWIVIWHGMSTYNTYAIFSTWISVLKTDVSFRPTAHLNERESLKSECKRHSSYCVRLNTELSYVRLSRVISSNFARCFQCTYVQKDRPRVVTYFFLRFFPSYKFYMSSW